MHSLHGNCKPQHDATTTAMQYEPSHAFVARRGETLRPNKSVSDIKCNAQSVHGLLESTSCKSAARAKHAPDHKKDLQHLFSSQQCAQSYQVLVSGRLTKKAKQCVGTLAD